MQKSAWPALLAKSHPQAQLALTGLIGLVLLAITQTAAVFVVLNVQRVWIQTAKHQVPRHAAKLARMGMSWSSEFARLARHYHVQPSRDQAAALLPTAALMVTWPAFGQETNARRALTAARPAAIMVALALQIAVPAKMVLACQELNDDEMM